MFSATRLSDGRVVVADAGSQQVRIFALDGKHLRTMGGRGGGPGEFQFLMWVGRFGPDSILAYDEGQRRLVAYGPTGELAGSVTLSLPGTPRARLRTPPRFTVIEVGADYVLGRALDDNDVESIRVYELRR